MSPLELYLGVGSRNAGLQSVCTPSSRSDHQELVLVKGEFQSEDTGTPKPTGTKIR